MIESKITTQKQAWVCVCQKKSLPLQPQRFLMHQTRKQKTDKLHMKDEGKIEVIGARVHNLKNINVSIPRKRLTVITGLSGSGKSSLAFDTIFAEGQRRYMETFSSYARGFIGNMQRPDVDKITGLSPVISIDQKTTSKNPRSTVGTITEIYDFLRLLYARAADAYSYVSGKKMVQYTDQQIIELITKEYADKKILLLAPLVSGRKGHYKELFDSIRKKGFMHVRVDGEICELTQGMKVDRYKVHTIEVVVDRIKVKANEDPDSIDTRRLRQSVDKAMTQGNGMMMIVEAMGRESEEAKVRYLSRNLMCPESGISYQTPAPHTFSFNSPSGWCPQCKGLGKVQSSEYQVQSSENGVVSSEIDEIILQDNWWEELVRSTKGQATENTHKQENEEEQDEWCVCPSCQGKRLSKEALSYRLGGYSIADLTEMDIETLLGVLSSEIGVVSSELTDRQKAIAEPILKEICARLRFMQSVGLSYLSLSRSSDSLSGGESQRIRLATQIGSRLVNVLYILDEPSIGLHQRDNERLINSLKELRDLGNSVIVVEHDEQMMREADWIIDIGPKAGRLGGEVLFCGTPEELLKTDTLTAKYLKYKVQSSEYRVPSTKEQEKCIILRGCTGNNLKNITLRIPLSKMICVTGVSGSGKSSLINRTLYPILSQHFYRSKQGPLPYESIEGIEHIDKVINVDQSPIGRTPRSNPATYTGVFNDIRELFAQLPEAKIRGWKAGRFSFNAKGGRCEECAGNGYKTIPMHFLPDVYVPCEVCGAQRYNRETLEVRWKGKTIANILDMTINQAVEFFASQPAILRKIKTIQDVGLGYIKLGQSATTLSGGESQRIKLATELARPSTGKTIYILDEPTTGLHFEDIRVLLGVLQQLVEKGNTVLIIEHNTDVIKACDWIIDLGPEGGRNGGEIVAEGTVEEIRENKNSLTGLFL